MVLGMDALVTACSWNKNGITAWAWMGLLFGNGCSGHRMLVEHERDYGLGMDGLIVWACMLWSRGKGVTGTTGS